MDKNLQDTVKLVATEVRYWAECSAVGFGHDEESLCGMCAIASAQLWRGLKQHGITAKLIMSEFVLGSHVYLVVDDHVVDVTATQFHEFRNKDLLIMHTKEAEVYEFYQSVKEFDTPEQLREYQARARWPKNQTALVA